MDFNKINKSVFDLSQLENIWHIKIEWILVNEHCKSQMKNRWISLDWLNSFSLFISAQKESNWEKFSWWTWYKWIIEALNWYLVVKLFKNKKTEKIFLKILSVLTHDQLVTSNNLKFWSHWTKYITIFHNWLYISSNSNSELLRENQIILKTGIQNSTQDFYFDNFDHIDVLKVLSSQFWYKEISKFIEEDTSMINW